jgi:hypothetical protein
MNPKHPPPKIVDGPSVRPIFINKVVTVQKDVEGTILLTLGTRGTFQLMQSNPG